jgi:hypothetical protein
MDLLRKFESILPSAQSYASTFRSGNPKYSTIEALNAHDQAAARCLNPDGQLYILQSDDIAQASSCVLPALLHVRSTDTLHCYFLDS